MPRDKEFDPKEALQCAMMLFWEKGYLETSYDDLVQVTGVNRYGLYSAFGDKYQFFLKTIDHYSETQILFQLGPMEQPEASTPEIQRFFNLLIGNLETPQRHFGCLIGNSAVEIAEPHAALLSRIKGHFERMKTAFENALQNAQRLGEIPASRDIHAGADFLVGVAMGYLVYVRAGMSPNQVKHFIEVALTHLSQS
jgi:TetR/AcrR family transcriptional regulator, transcriptional repressor for nem operon